MVDITGTAGDDSLIGAAENDLIQGLGGNDTLAGGAGDDSLHGGYGDDQILGGAGDDFLTGSVGDDWMSGGLGNDTYSGHAGHDTAVFEEEFDSLSFTVNSNRIVVRGDYVDTVFAFETFVFAGVSYSFDEVASVAVFEFVERIGTDGYDPLYATGYAERIEALAGDDYIDADGGDDLIYAGLGDDWVAGETGNDTIFGGEGADEISIRAGKWLEGHDVIGDFVRGEDTLYFWLEDILREEPTIMALSGDANVLELSDLDASADWSMAASEDGDVMLIHESGSVELDGIAFGQDWDSFMDLGDVLTIEGNVIPVGSTQIPPAPEGPILVTGNAWDEWLKGSAESETLDGLAGNDVIRGYAGDDTLLGGEGNDTLRGEAGDDQLTGGEGADIFAIRAGKWDEGHDVITDFQIGIDTIDLNSADMAKSTPGLAGLSGDPDIIEASDLDASADWTLQASTNGNLLIVHPTGSIEVSGIPFGDDVDSFSEVAAFITLDGVALSAGAPTCTDDGPNPNSTGGALLGTDDSDCLIGTNYFDDIVGYAGDDLIRGYGGLDVLHGGDGNDTLDGGEGINFLYGGAGADTFIIHVGTAGLIQNEIDDFDRDNDVLVFDAEEVAAVDPTLAGLAGDEFTLELADLDASPDWSVDMQRISGDGFGIFHPGGFIALPLLPGYRPNHDFSDLSDFIRIENNPEPEPTPEISVGNPWDEWLKGSAAADVLDGAGGNDVVRGYAGDDTLIGGLGDDTLRGEAGDDVLTGGDGADVIRIRSGKWDQGDDVVTDFQIGEDKLAFVAVDMLNRDADLASAASDDGLLGLDDLDAAAAFNIGASDDGDVLITHQTGSVEFDGIAFSTRTDSFSDLATLIEIEVA